MAGDIQQIIHAKSSIISTCQECPPGHPEIAHLHDNRYLQDMINHYLQKHGYKLLHVGQETDRDENGQQWQMTVAVLGK